MTEDRYELRVAFHLKIPADPDELREPVIEKLMKEHFEWAQRKIENKENFPGHGKSEHETGTVYWNVFVWDKEDMRALK